MSGLPDDEAPPGEGTGGAERRAPAAQEPSQAPVPLPRPVQEHIGRQLRSAYNAEAERPAFLGDPAVPPKFERLIRRIEVSEKVRELGVEAVRQALQPGVDGLGAEQRRRSRRDTEPDGTS